MILKFVILVPNLAKATPSDGYHRSQDQAKITASSDRKMESGNVSNPSLRNIAALASE